MHGNLFQFPSIRIRRLFCAAARSEFKGVVIVVGTQRGVKLVIYGDLRVYIYAASPGDIYRTDIKSGHAGTARRAAVQFGEFFNCWTIWLEFIKGIRLGERVRGFIHFRKVRF